MKTPMCYTWLESCGSLLSDGIKKTNMFSHPAEGAIFYDGPHRYFPLCWEAVICKPAWKIPFPFCWNHVMSPSPTEYICTRSKSCFGCLTELPCWPLFMILVVSCMKFILKMLYCSIVAWCGSTQSIKLRFQQIHSTNAKDSRSSFRRALGDGEWWVCKVVEDAAAATCLIA